MKTSHRFPNSICNTILMLISILILASHVYANKIVVGYYPSWYKSTLPAESILFEHLTHINHAFAWPDASGNLQMDNDLIYPELIQQAHEKDTKILISLGGWGNSDGFPLVATDPLKRLFFINNLVDFLNAHNYDGVDIDWEFPDSSNDRNSLTILITELRDRFTSENPDWLITFAVGTSNWSGQWYDYNELVHYVDWFNAMCYDYHGSWSAHSGHNAPLYQPPGDYDGAVDVGMNYLHNTRGIPKNQLTVGVPFYGKEFNSASLYGPFTGTVTDYTYNQIIPKMNGDWTYHWDDISKVPYLTNSTNTKLISFDDTVSIRHKCEWIQEQDYLGGMIWALGQDLSNNEQVLLETIGTHLLNPTSVSIEPTGEQSDDFILYDNYPNPFNPATMISFTIKNADDVTLDVYNLNGQKVSTLLNGWMSDGAHSVFWNGTNDSGNPVPSGFYFYRIQTGAFRTVRKMILLK
ncbi:T9SS type A sorting domain-containing protein [candidate division KSB1 bacterium]|nr:T9SS type A sorting domain-containing protein [candidate division KSB1 bacterium]